MPRTGLGERLISGPLILDGAMGTQLMARGIEAGTCNDYLNIAKPEIVASIHQAYVDAGSDAVITNTLGASRHALARHGHGDDAAAVNRAGAQLARQATGRDRYVLGDIGPTGDFLEPLGTLKASDLRGAFTEQAEALLAGGVDGFIIETMTALDELEIAVEAVRSICGDLPVFGCMAFDKGGGGFRTMMGVDVSSAVAKMLALDVDVVGFNCGTVSLDDYVRLAAEYVGAVRAAGSHAPVVAEPNAGKPELLDDRAVYNVSPDDFAAAAAGMCAAGATVIGGCCGTSPEHIRAVVRTLKG